MFAAVSYLEDMIVKFLTAKLTDDEKRQLFSAHDCEREIDEQTEDEMKHALYQYVLNNVAWWKIIEKVKDDVESENENESSDEEED